MLPHPNPHRRCPVLLAANPPIDTSTTSTSVAAGPDTDEEFYSDEGSESGAAAEEWERHVPAAERARWRHTLHRDRGRQASGATAGSAEDGGPPLSEAYRSGQPQRKAAGLGL